MCLRDGSSIHKCLVLMEKLTDDLKCFLYWYSREEAYHVEAHHDVRFTKGSLGNALHEVSGVLHVGIGCTLQWVQDPDQLPC